MCPPHHRLNQADPHRRPARRGRPPATVAKSEAAGGPRVPANRQAPSARPSLDPPGERSAAPAALPGPSRLEESLRSSGGGGETTTKTTRRGRGHAAQALPQTCGQWLAAEAGLEDLPAEPLALYLHRPPWTEEESRINFSVDLPTSTRRTDPPDKRREAALQAIDLLPPADVTTRSDGSAREETTCGGAGALVQLHCLGREERVRAPAGAVCSSLRAELVAMREALTRITSIPEAEQGRVRSVRLLTDSRSDLQLLQRGPAGQVTALAADVWQRLQDLSTRGTAVYLKWCQDTQAWTEMKTPTALLEKQQ